VTAALPKKTSVRRFKKSCAQDSKSRLIVVASPSRSLAKTLRQANARGAAMDHEIDYDLTTGHWETLKALRTPRSRHLLNRFVLDDLVAIGLVSISDDVALVTQTGRKALVRGSSRLWDVAA
jgi:hypothetical protein